MKTSKMNLMVSLALCFFVLFSCEKNEPVTAIGDTSEEYFAMSNFSGIEISVPAKVTLTNSDKYDVTVETYQNILKYLEVKVENNILEISLGNKNIRIDEDMEIHINMKGLNKIALSGRVDLNIGAFGVLDKLNVDMSGDVKVNFTENGTSVDELDIDISGIGKFKGYLLESTSCNINLSGQCLAEISVTETLTVDASGSCTVHYKGDPVNVSINSSGDQDIIKVD